jgi:energy-coupling factor transport system substrate-specific component
MQSTGIPHTYILALIPSAVALNFVGAFIAGVLRLPIFLGLVGTIIVCLITGPWWGVLSALLTSVVISLIQGPIYLVFGLVSSAAAIVVGNGARFNMTKTLPRYFVISLLVGLVSALVSVPIYLHLFGGATGHPTDVIIAAFTAVGQPLSLFVTYTKVLVGLTDKPLQCFLALAILEALPTSFTGHLDFVKAFNMRRILLFIGITVILVLILIIVLANMN